MYHRRNTPKNTIFHSAGWLFADLLLALTIIFIAASAAGKPVEKAHPKITPTPIVPFIKGLNPQASYVTINIDANALQQNDPAAIQAIKDQVKYQLKGR